MGKPEGSKLVLITPKIEHSTAVAGFLAEFEAQKEPDYHGFAWLEEYTSYPDWLDFLEIAKDPEKCGKNRVPAETLFAWNYETKQIIGIVNIRYFLNDYLLQYGGHIGLSVRPQLRGLGYGSQILGLALQRCRELAIYQVLITCNQDNQASAKMIKNNGGVLENEVREERGMIIQRYWITLSDKD